MVGNQTNFSPAKFREILIPNFDQKFQYIIEQLVFSAFQKHKETGSLYSQAEQLLLSELGLLDWKPKHQLWFSKNYSDAQSADRIDAEYFQPMYEEIIEKFKGNANIKYLKEITHLVGHPSNPPYTSKESEGKTFIITQKHLGTYYPSDNFWDDPEALYTTDEFIKRNRKFLLKKNDIILYWGFLHIPQKSIFQNYEPLYIRILSERSIG